MRIKVEDLSRRPKIIIMVSKFDHALLHILYQIKVGWLNAEVAAIVSNHEDSRRTAEQEGIPFHYWPVNKENKAEREEQLIELVRITAPSSSFLPATCRFSPTICRTGCSAW